jgi:anti-sigma factor RsiW
MNTSGRAQMPCDAAFQLISRRLDGDLTRAETQQLYRHLAVWESCHVQMAEMAAMAAQLEERKSSFAYHHQVPSFLFPARTFFQNLLLTSM